MTAEVRAVFEWIHMKMGIALDLSISSERLINYLVADFLDLGQLRADKFRQIERVFKISEPLDEVQSILQGKAIQKHIQISTSYLEIYSNSRVNCDADRLKQVLLNLLSNALKFTP